MNAPVITPNTGRLPRRPSLAPSTKRVPERMTLSLDRRLDVAGAPEVRDRLKGTMFTPADALLWASMDVEGQGRWSVYLWGACDRLNQVTSFEGPIEHGELVIHNAPPQWALDQLQLTLADVTTTLTRLR